MKSAPQSWFGAVAVKARLTRSPARHPSLPGIVVRYTDGTHHLQFTCNEPHGIFFAASTRDLVAQTRQAFETVDPQTHEEPAVAGGLSLSLLSEPLLLVCRVRVTA